MAIIRLHHGTDSTTALVLQQGQIDTTKGSGELGRGFYLGTSLRLAKRRAFHKSFGRRAISKKELHLLHNNVLRTEFDDRKSNNLRSERLSLQKANILYHTLRKNRQTRTYRFRKDYVSAPIVGNSNYYNVEQQKWESKRGETFLNGLSTLRTLL